MHTSYFLLLSCTRKVMQSLPGGEGTGDFLRLLGIQLGLLVDFARENREYSAGKLLYS